MIEGKQVLPQKQVKSKQRVADHGEVFTSEREVNAMLDLVKQQTEGIESRFLEPACGDGNFLAEILRRKLVVVKKKYKVDPIDYEKKSVLAVSTIYGVDILQDNVDACRTRLFEIWDKEYKRVCKKEVNQDCRDAVRFILSRNIVCGNALTLMKVDAFGWDTGEPIVFSEWALVTGSMMQRRDYTFDKLLKGNEPGRVIFGLDTKGIKSEPSQQTLFDKSAMEQPKEEGEFLKQYIMHYRRVHLNDR